MISQKLHSAKNNDNLFYCPIIWFEIELTVFLFLNSLKNISFLCLERNVNQQHAVT